MRYEEIPIQADNSLPEAMLNVYLLDTPGEKIKIQRRPMVVICPGGGYAMTSYREGEPLAMHFLSHGCHACVLRYSTAPARFPVPLLELGLVMKTIHAYAQEWQVDKEHIFLQGSSAGGHLAGMLGAFWNDRKLAAALGVDRQILRPKGILLSYPVISTEAGYIHRESFENLLGDDYDRYLEKLSLEKQVSADIPPCFLWHTVTDGTVSVGNSIAMASALIKAGVATELHIFPDGEHGLSLASPLVERLDGSGVNDACKNWAALADEWIARLCRQ